MKPFFITMALVLGATPVFGAPAPGSCPSLAALTLPNARVTSAVEVAAGAFAVPSSGGRGSQATTQALAAMPAFCRVTMTINADERLRHQDRDLAAGVPLEWKASGRR